MEQQSIIFVCEISQGSYEEYSETPCCAFSQEKDATAFCERLTAFLMKEGVHEDQDPRRGKTLTFEEKEYRICSEGARVYHFPLTLNPIG